MKELIELIKTGDRVRVKQAQKEIEKMCQHAGYPRTNKIKGEWRIFLDELDTFHKIADIDHQCYFINTLKWPMLMLGHDHFEQFAGFFLSNIQHESGKIRQAVIHAVNWLLLTICDFNLDTDYRGRKLSNKVKEEHRKNINRFCLLVLRTEELIEQHHQPRYDRCKYVSSIPIGVYKSLQKLMVEALLPSDHREKIYQKFLADYEGLRAETGKTFILEYMQYHNCVDWNEFSYNKATILIVAQKELFDKKITQDRKKELLFLLGHIGTLPAYKLIKKYLQSPAPQLSAWAEQALDECKTFLGAEIMEEDQATISRL